MADFSYLSIFTWSQRSNLTKWSLNVKNGCEKYSDKKVCLRVFICPLCHHVTVLNTKLGNRLFVLRCISLSVWTISLRTSKKKFFLDMRSAIEITYVWSTANAPSGFDHWVIFWGKNIKVSYKCHLSDFVMRFIFFWY